RLEGIRGAGVGCAVADLRHITGAECGSAHIAALPLLIRRARRGAPGAELLHVAGARRGAAQGTGVASGVSACACQARLVGAGVEGLQASASAWIAGTQVLPPEQRTVVTLGAAAVPPQVSVPALLEDESLPFAQLQSVALQPPPPSASPVSVQASAWTCVAD